MFCESCNEHPATVFITQIAEDEITQLRLCEVCARQRAESIAAENGEEPPEEVVFEWFDEINDTQDGLSFENGAGSDDDDEFSTNGMFRELQNHPFNDEFPSDEDLADELDDLDNEDDFDELPRELAAQLQGDDEDADDIFSSSLDQLLKANPFDDGAQRREIAARRCPKCSITWDRLRQDGRAGCAHCYETFADQLHEVMQRVQHAPQHHGKKPRAAEKRRNRLEHLRARRDHRLAMLNRRLDEAVRAEKYEEAAKLRDQIKMVSSTIIQEN
jgi:protein arginine kinase activator